MDRAEVKEIRERLGLTQEQLSERLGLKQPWGKDTVRAWENGRTAVTGPAALALRLVDRISRSANQAARAVLDGLWTGA